MISFALVKRIILVVALLAALSLGLVAAQLFLIGENPFDYHVDPLAISDLQDSNTYLVAPSSYALTTPHRESPVYETDPSQLMLAIDAIALNSPRTKLAAGATLDQWATYVQRTRVMRFPDYVSVVTIGLPEGRSTLAIYSQSVYGVDDFGVNKARVERWLGQLEEKLKGVRVK